MEVIYSCSSALGGTGIAQVVERAATGIYRRGYLKKAVVYGNKQREIPRKYIVDVWFQPMKIFSCLPAIYYYFLKRMYLDLVATRSVRRGCDVFHGWAGECVLALKEAKRVGAVSFMERPAPHPHRVRALLDEEYAKYGIDPRGRFGRSRVIHRVLETLQLRECDRADFVMAPSDYVCRSFLEERYPANRLMPTYRGVDGDTFRPGQKSDSTFRVAFVGLVCVRKGIKYLLEAWSRLQLKNAELVFAGSIHDEVRPLLSEYAWKVDVKLQGFLADPVKVYQNSSVFVLPSIVEGSAKVTYEAMACGVPVIVTPNAGSVARDGQDGFIIPIRDVEALQEKILYFYENEDERRRMGENARKHMETYTWKRYQQDLVAVYEKALEERGRARSQ